MTVTECDGPGGGGGGGGSCMTSCSTLCLMYTAVEFGGSVGGGPLLFGNIAHLKRQYIDRKPKPKPQIQPEIPQLDPKHLSLNPKP